MTTHTHITYHINNQPFESVLIYPQFTKHKLPGLVMVPNWMGITQEAINLAKYQASKGYFILITDLYGKNIRPTTPEQASAAMMPVKTNINLLRLRMNTALEVLKQQADYHPINPNKLAAFGFCFGGCCALELARSGAPIQAAISFHGTLDTPNPSDAKNIKSSILVLDGADDPLVPRAQIPEFMKEMTTANVDWQLISYGGAVHGFTDITANDIGVKQYNKKVTERAFKAMNQLLDEVFNP